MIKCKWRPQAGVARSFIDVGLRDLAARNREALHVCDLRHPEAQPSLPGLSTSIVKWHWWPVAPVFNLIW
jgi:hypothetical protein